MNLPFCTTLQQCKLPRSGLLEQRDEHQALDGPIGQWLLIHSGWVIVVVRQFVRITLEEIIPVKIDWKKFKKLFPNELTGWELPLKAKFPDRDLSGMNDSYAAAMDALYSKLPATLKKPLGMFVASTTVNYVDCIDFESYEIDGEYDPEELMDVVLPRLDPRKMKQVAAALEKIKAIDYRAAITEAWNKSKVKDNEAVTDRLPTAKAFVTYLEYWIAAFDEINKEGAVLGIVSA